MKTIRFKLNILIIALILTVNTPDLIFAQNNSNHQKPKSTTTRYQNLYDNSSSSTLSEASNRNYDRNTKSNNNFLDEYKQFKNQKPEENYTDRYDRREPQQNNDNFDNRFDRNERRDYNNRNKDNYTTNEKGTENYFHFDRTGRTLWDGKHWELTDFPLKIYVKESSSRYYKSVYKDYVTYALNVWRKADDRINFTIVNSEREADISLYFIENLGDKYKEDYLGLTEYDMGGKRVIDYSKIQISLMKFGDDVVSDGEIKATIIHEFGHALGLGHSENEYDIMYPYISDDHTADMNYDELSRGDKGAIEDVIDLGDEEIYVRR
jgi:predicted Zn-dependent protease